MLLGIVLDGLKLVAISGDDKAVYQPIMSLVVHAISFNTCNVAVLVVGYTFGVAASRIDGYSKTINTGDQAKRIHEARVGTGKYQRVIDSRFGLIDQRLGSSVTLQVMAEMEPL